MDTNARNAILAAVVGDALGSAVDGLGMGHIRAHFRHIDDYLDPEPALKGKMERWRKPGLYTSISQFLLIGAMACSRRGPCRDEFIRLCAGASGGAGSGSGIFRSPDGVEKNFIARVQAGELLSGAPASPCPRIIPAAALLGSRSDAPAERMADIVPFVRLFTLDVSTAALSLFLASLLPALGARGAGPGDLLRTSMEVAHDLAADVEANSAALFGLGASPDALAGELRGLEDLLSGMCGAGSQEAAARMICGHVNRGLKTPVTRATVSLPAALVPYSLALCAFHGDGPSLLFHAVAEGGSTAPLAALAGAVGACCHESVVPETLLRNLVNRRRILSLADSLGGDAGLSHEADDFIRSEFSLTAKEEEELRARLRHHKKKPKPQTPTRADREKKLARHAVESWTKLDKARWKKERKQMDKKNSP